MEKIENQATAPSTEDKEEGSATASGSPSLHLDKQVIRTLSGEELKLGGGGIACTFRHRQVIPKSSAVMPEKQKLPRGHGLLR
jgi:hypothetical protein